MELVLLKAQKLSNRNFDNFKNALYKNDKAREKGIILQFKALKMDLVSMYCKLVLNYFQEFTRTFMNSTPIK